MLPASPQMRNRYASALTEAGRFEEAVREFEHYARLAPREPNPFDSLGGVYLTLGKPAEAIQSYSRALDIDPGFPSGTGLAYTFGMLGRFEEAIAARPSIVHVHALLLSRTGRHAEAERILRNGLARAQIDNNMFIAAGIHLTSAMLSLERMDYAAVQREVRCDPRPAVCSPSRIRATLGVHRRYAGRPGRPWPGSYGPGRGACRQAGAHVPAVAPGRAPLALVLPGRAGARARRSCCVRLAHSPRASRRGAAYHSTSRVRS